MTSGTTGECLGHALASAYRGSAPASPRSHGERARILEHGARASARSPSWRRRPARATTPDRRAGAPGERVHDVAAAERPRAPSRRAGRSGRRGAPRTGAPQDELRPPLLARATGPARRPGARRLPSTSAVPTWTRTRWWLASACRAPGRISTSASKRIGRPRERRIATTSPRVTSRDSTPAQVERDALAAPRAIDPLAVHLEPAHARGRPPRQHAHRIAVARSRRPSPYR